MKTIIAGKRDYDNKDFVNRMIEGYILHTPITEIFEGGAPGVDEIAMFFAINNNIPVKHFPADWEKQGKQAGPIRNQAMVDEAEALLAFWDGKSKGTGDVIKKAQKKGIKITIIDI